MDNLCVQTASCAINQNFHLLPIWTGAPALPTRSPKSYQVLSLYLQNYQPIAWPGDTSAEDAVAEALEEWGYTGDDVDIYQLKEVTMISLDRTCLGNDASKSWRSCILFYSPTKGHDKWKLILKDPFNELLLDKELWCNISVRQIIGAVFDVQ